MADQRLGVDAAQFFLADREGHHRHVGGFQALVGQFLVERHVGVAVDGGDHRGLAAGGELLDVGDDGLVVAVAERGVDLLDVLVGDALAVQEAAQDLVGGARVDVVGAEQEEALGGAAVLAHQVLHRRDGLLVRRGAGVEDVRRQLFALVLHRVEQQAVELLEHRQHGFARHAGPAAEHHVDLVLAQQLAGLLGEQRPVGGRIDHHRLELLAVDPALGVDLVDGHQRHVFQRGLGNRHGAGQRMQDADLDGLGGLDGPAHAHGGDGGGKGESLDQAATLHGAISISQKLGGQLLVGGSLSIGDSRHPCACIARSRALCNICRVILRTSDLLTSMWLFSNSCASSPRRARIAPRISPCSA
ncbi:hypothetical protein FQZ97_515890 [compost metagenome]